MSIFENLFVSLNGEESRILTIKKIPREAKTTRVGESQIEHIVHTERNMNSICLRDTKNSRLNFNVISNKMVTELLVTMVC